MLVPLSSPDLTELEKAAVANVLDTQQLSLGPRLPDFEQSLAAVAGTRFAVAVNSGTSALHLCIRGFGIGPGDEVITTPFSFVASANCILFERAKPIFVDVDPRTFNIDPSAVESAITPRTKALLPVHVFGIPCPLDPLMKIAGDNDLVMIEDSCEAIGATYKGRPVGGIGHAGTFAFYPNKQVTTGEGGALVTNDARLAAMSRSLRNQGRGEDGEWLSHERLGFNYRLSDINCALGTAQLRRLTAILEKRRTVAAIYNNGLHELEEIAPPLLEVQDSTISWFVYVVTLRSEFGGRRERDAILKHLSARGVGCSNYFAPIHLQRFYREQFGYREGQFPIAESVSERTIALPFYNRLSEGEISLVIRELKAAVASVCSGRFQAVGSSTA